MTVYPIRGLLFDNDGVLVESDAASAEAWNRWATTWAPGFDFERDIEHGKRARDTVAQLVAAEDVDRASAHLEQLEVETAYLVTALPGAYDLLTSLPAGTWTVVTSGVDAVASSRLAAAGLPRPDAIVTGNDVQRGKPAPDPYLLGAKRLGLDPVDCVVFEDAVAGIAAGQAAGAGVTVGVGERGLETQATVVVSSLAGIGFDGSHLDLRNAFITREHGHPHSSAALPGDHTGTHR